MPSFLTVRHIRIVVTLLMCTCATSAQAQQNGPWNSPLLIAEEISPDVFGIPRIFQDSSGVPCVVCKPGTDTMYCVFQWFREPRNGPTWDKVAVKMSTDEGATWTAPIPIVVTGLPQGYQRPFDPTIVCFGDSIRVYFSSSARFPQMGLDSVVNTYSAVGGSSNGFDGVQYVFEPGIRFDNATRPVIDPAVQYLNGNWRYIAPIGAPQEGAYQGISTDGLTFTQMDNIASDNTHNWTGNLMPDETGHLHFYGSGPELWRSPDSVFGRWGTYRLIGLHGGDPSAVQRKDGSRMIIYVGPRYVTAVEEDRSAHHQMRVAHEGLVDIGAVLVPRIGDATGGDATGGDASGGGVTDVEHVTCMNIHGQSVMVPLHGTKANVSSLAPGVYVMQSVDHRYLMTFLVLPR